METDRHILLIIKHLCKKHNIPLLLACTEETPAQYQFLLKNNFDWCVVPISPQHPGYAKEWTLFPFDAHYNTKATDVVAETIHIALKDLLDNGRTKPPIEKLNMDRNQNDDFSAVDKFIYPVF